KSELLSSQTQADTLGSERKALAQKYQEQQQHCKDLLQLVSQEEQLAHYRQLLKDDEACPLCGASEHPHAAAMAIDIPDTVARKQQADTLLTQLEQDGKAVREKLDALQLKIKDLHSRLTNISTQQTELLAQWQASAKALQLDCVISDEQGLQAYERQLKNQLEEISSQLKQLNQLDKERQASKEALNITERERDKLTSDLNLLEQRQQTLQQNLQHTTAEYQKLLETVHNNRSALLSSITALGLTAPAENELLPWLQSKRQDVQHYQQKAQQKDQLSQQLAGKNAEHIAAEQQLQTVLKQLTAVQTEQAGLKQQWDEAASQRQQLFGEKTVAQAREAANAQLRNAEQAQQLTTGNHKQIAQQHNDLLAAIKAITQQQGELERTRSERSAKWDALLADSPFASQSEFATALLPEEKRSTLLTLKQKLDSQLQRANTLLEQSADQLGDLNRVEDAAQWQQTPLDDVKAVLQQLQGEKDTLVERRGGISSQLSADQKETARQQSLLTQIEQQRQDYDQLSTLHGLIGSASGDKFRRFAQGLTLDNLVYLANKQLDRIHGRYLLKRKDEDGLALSVLDTWQGDVERDTKTLSGGESFLVSLALALALSDLVSHKTSIDSLFLDEGFGTLDSETLDIALDALDNLNASGKMIGVISHIEAMKERIPVQLRVTKKSGLGVSELDREFAV
ncbi:MAG: exonuclease SbcC, partial [Oleiphilaceae bacterium]